MDPIMPNLCPVCGFDLGFPAWNGKSASDEICPCCYIQFGYDDLANGDADADARKQIYLLWRKHWIEGGMKWHAKGRNPPEGWNPAEQLRQIGVVV
jgi:hypothetical protein